MPGSSNVLDLVSRYIKLLEIETNCHILLYFFSMFSNVLKFGSMLTLTTISCDFYCNTKGNSYVWLLWNVC